jgi:hypothetical protein
MRSGPGPHRGMSASRTCSMPTERIVKNIRGATRSAIRPGGAVERGRNTAGLTADMNGLVSSARGSPRESAAEDQASLALKTAAAGSLPGERCRCARRSSQKNLTQPITAVLG